MDFVAQINTVTLLFASVWGHIGFNLLVCQAQGIRLVSN